MANILYYGDNLEVLRKYVADETIDLCYIDPPFNSKRNYNQIYNNIGAEEDRAQAQAFVDTWVWDSEAEECWAQIVVNHGNRLNYKTIELIKGLYNVLGKGSLLAYIVSMTLRVVEIRRVLKRTGSFYLHCDSTASHYLKLMLDTVFVSEGGDYKNEIIWSRTNAHNVASKYFSRVQDTILFYTKSDKYTWNSLYTDYSPQQLKRYSLDPETGRMVTGQDLTMTGNAHKNFTWRGSTPPPNRGWGFSEEQLEALWEQGLILKKQDGTPRLDGRKVFLDEKLGKPLGSVWTDIERVGNTSSERLGYPTQKPEALLERMVRASTNENDIILDAFCGCGTTIAVAQHLKRKWIGIDITYQSIAVILRRLEQQFGKDEVDTVVLNGIPRDMASARALANKKDDRVRKEFEKWSILTYTNNRALINEKKGGDAGVDGRAYFQASLKDTGRIILQVKSGNVGRGDIAKLRGDMLREQAELGIFITLEPPTQGMTQEAVGAGLYDHELMGRKYPVIQVVTIREIIEDKRRLDIPMSLEVLKSAQLKEAGGQMSLMDP